MIWPIGMGGMAREKVKKDGKVGIGPGVVLAVVAASKPFSKPMTAMICPIWGAMDGMAREGEEGAWRGSGGGGSGEEQTLLQTNDNGLSDLGGDGWNGKGEGAWGSSGGGDGGEEQALLQTNDKDVSDLGGDGWNGKGEGWEGWDGKVGMGPGAVLVAAAGGKSRPGSKTMVTMIGLIGIGGSTIQFTVASTKHRPELRER